LGYEKFGSLHMRVVDNISTKTIGDYLKKLGCGIETEEGQQFLEAILNNNVWRSCESASENTSSKPFKYFLRDPRNPGNLLRVVVDTISEVERVIAGTHRGVSEKYLQSYLSEICYRFNRRFREKELFELVVRACVSIETNTYNQLKNGDVIMT
ncbi:unnamed protein product, partial [marine sediment metagenome]